MRVTGSVRPQKPRGAAKTPRPAASVVRRFKVLLADAADRTMPVRRQVFERHVVMLRRIVDPAADLAHVLLVYRFTPRRAPYFIGSPLFYRGAAHIRAVLAFASFRLYSRSNLPRNYHAARLPSFGLSRHDLQATAPLPSPLPCAASAPRPCAFLSATVRRVPVPSSLVLCAVPVARPDCPNPCPE